MKNNVTTKVIKTAMILWMAIITVTTNAQKPVPVGDTEVGTLPGSFSVSPSGAATYAIPIDLPPGRAGMTPELAFVYNNHTPSTIMG